MGAAQFSQEVILITETTLQSSLFLQVFESRLQLKVSLCPIDTISKIENLPDDPRLIIIDLSVMNESYTDDYLAFKQRYFPDVEEVLINCQEGLNEQQLVFWQQLCGIFYYHDSVEILEQGIEKILKGEMWLSRKMSQKYITVLRQNRRPVKERHSADLTRRETEIMSLLAQGKTNHQMADLLFVSENTIKTHLHNIFKKIGVDNRVQALIWVNESSLDVENTH